MFWINLGFYAGLGAALALADVYVFEWQYWLILCMVAGIIITERLHRND